MAFVTSFATDAGAHAKKNSKPNEDAAHAFTKDDVGYQIISDGNGSVNDMKPAGFVVNEISRFIDKFSYADMTGEEIKALITQACYCANRVLMAYKRANEELYPSSNFATLTMTAVTQNNEFVYAHCGDSRLYIIRDGKITQFSKDHTLAQQLCDEGKITKAEVFSHPDNGVLYSALGFPQPRIDSMVGRVKQGDILLAITDGIHKYLDLSQIMAVIQQAGNCSDTCDGLIKYANSLGGMDNMAVTVTYIAE